MSTFFGLEIGRRGVAAQQRALTTVGHNIANANTEGYTRQRVNMTATNPLYKPSLNRPATPGQIGTGVQVSSITRLREEFFDHQFRNENQSLADWQAQKQTLEKIELIFNEPGDDGLRSVIDEFWNAWQDLSREPDNLSARTALKEQSQAMVDAFQHVDKKLSELRADLQNSIDVQTSMANTYLHQIADLNREIRRVEGHGDNANDLRDQRDLIVDQLSELMHIEVREDSEAMVDIRLIDDDGNPGELIVNGLDYVEFVEDASANEGNPSNPNAAGVIEISEINGGELAGLRHSRDTITGNYQSHLQSMVHGLLNGEIEVEIPAGTVIHIAEPDGIEYFDADSGTWVTMGAGDDFVEIESDTLVRVNGINGLHSLGWTLSEENGEPVGGGAFFDFSMIEIEGEEVLDIQSVQVSDDILHDVSRIAASLRVDVDEGDLESVIDGNGDLALLMGQLRDTTFQFQSDTLADGEGTFDEYFRAVLGELGVQTREANRQVNNQQVILNNIENNRQSVSGVSLDEEMANMVQFQHAYNAAARHITSVDQQLDTIINRMGIVGR